MNQYFEHISNLALPIGIVFAVLLGSDVTVRLFCVDQSWFVDRAAERICER